MKIVKLIVAFFYCSTQVVLAGSAGAPIQNLPNIQTLQKQLPTHSQTFSPATPSLNSNSYKDIRMLYIAGKFAGASLEVEGVSYKITLDEEGNSLLIRYRLDEERDWVVGQGSVNEEGGRVLLTLTFNSGATFLVSYSRTSGEMVISQREESWVRLPEESSPTAVPAWQKEEATSTYLYNKEGWLENSLKRGLNSRTDELGNITLGVFQYHTRYGYSPEGKLIDSFESGSKVTYNDSDFSIHRTESSKRYSFINGEAKLLKSDSKSQKELPTDKSQKKLELPLLFGQSATERLGHIIEEGVRQARRYALSASLKGQGNSGSVLMGIVSLPKSLASESLFGVKDCRDPKDGLIQYIYNSGGTSGGFSPSGVS